MSAYHQIRIQPADIDKTAIVSTLGLDKYNIMPHPLAHKDAVAAFQRFMEKIFRDVNCVFVYIDDILIFSDGQSSHKKDIRIMQNIIYEVLHNNNFKIKISLAKSTFDVAFIDFLG